ncbi:hypothetical protein TUMSATVNIG3_47790 [Vibrio nigripulchritudo]|nr:hypothetical protein TUMSATVNIG2_47150 [Vibrio nigripulchritudo]BDU45981.1 hypothetical protein TUMSATVNIG3_47790 [Vibrio nigripulchritudo]
MVMRISHAAEIDVVGGMGYGTEGNRYFVYDTRGDDIIRVPVGENDLEGSIILRDGNDHVITDGKLVDILIQDYEQTPIKKTLEFHADKNNISHTGRIKNIDFDIKLYSGNGRAIIGGYRELVFDATNHTPIDDTRYDLYLGTITEFPGRKEHLKLKNTDVVYRSVAGTGVASDSPATLIEFYGNSYLNHETLSHASSVKVPNKVIFHEGENELRFGWQSRHINAEIMDDAVLTNIELAPDTGKYLLDQSDNPYTLKVYLPSDISDFTTYWNEEKYAIELENSMGNRVHFTISQELLKKILESDFYLPVYLLSPSGEQVSLQSLLSEITLTDFIAQEPIVNQDFYYFFGTVLGTNQDDVIRNACNVKSGLGNDTLIQTRGNSIGPCIYDLGSGNDTVEVASTSQPDKIISHGGVLTVKSNQRFYESYYSNFKRAIQWNKPINKDDIVAAKVGLDLEVTLSATDSIVLKDYFLSNQGLLTASELRLSDGSSIYFQELANPISPVFGFEVPTESADRLVYAYWQKEHVESLAGDDFISGARSVDAGEGIDTIIMKGHHRTALVRAGAGNDTITLATDTHATLYFDQGDECDVVKSDRYKSIYSPIIFRNLQEPRTTLEFGEGITPDDLTLSFDGNECGVKNYPGAMSIAYPGGNITLDEGINIDAIAFVNGDRYTFTSMFPSTAMKVTLHDEGGSISSAKDDVTTLGGMGRDVMFASYMDGNAGADTVQLNNNSAFYDLGDTCGVNSERCAESELILAHSSASIPLKGRIHFSGGVSASSLKVLEYTQRVKLAYGHDDVIEVDEQVAFSPLVTYEFTDGTIITGEELSRGIQQQNYIELTEHDDRYSPYIETDTVVRMLAGDDTYYNYKGIIGVVDPGKGNDFLRQPSHVMINKGYQEELIEGPYPKGLTLEFTDRTLDDIRNANISITQDSDYRGTSFQLNVDFGNYDIIKVKNVMECYSFCSVENILIRAQDADVSLLDFDHLVEPLLFFTLISEIDLLKNESGKLKDNTILKFQTLNLDQSYQFSLYRNDKNICTISYDKYYTWTAPIVDPMQCLLRVDDLNGQDFELTARYQFKDRSFEFRTRLPVNVTGLAAPNILSQSPSSAQEVNTTRFSPRIEHDQIGVDMDVYLNGNLIYQGLFAGNRVFLQSLSIAFSEGENQVRYVLRNSQGEDSVTYLINYVPLEVKPVNTIVTRSKGVFSVSWDALGDQSKYHDFKVFGSNIPISSDIDVLEKLTPIATTSEYLHTYFVSSGKGNYYHRVAALDVFGQIVGVSKLIVYDITPSSATLVLSSDNQVGNTLGPGQIKVTMAFEKEVEFTSPIYIQDDNNKYSTYISPKREANTNTYIASFDPKSIRDEWYGVRITGTVYDEDGNRVYLSFDSSYYVDLYPAKAYLSVSSSTNRTINYIPGSELQIRWSFQDYLSTTVEPEFYYQLSGPNRQKQRIEQSSVIDKETNRPIYVAFITLPSDVSAAEQENITFSFRAVDRFGNVSVNDYALYDGVFMVVNGDDVPPAAPQYVSLSANQNSVDVVWETVSVDEDLSHFELSVDGSEVVRLEKNATSHIITDLAKGTTYQLALSAVDLAGNRSETEKRWISTQMDNPILTITEVKDEQITLEWQTPEHGGALTGYYFYQSTAPFDSVANMQHRKVVNQYVPNKLVLNELYNGEQYYFALVSKSRYGEIDPNVIAVSAIPEKDEIGPVVDSVMWNMGEFTQGTLLERAGQWQVKASDVSGLSRMEVMIDGEFYQVDTSANDTFAANFDPAGYTDGEHQVTFSLYDVYDNQTDINLNFNTALAVPTAPQIVTPAGDVSVGERWLPISVRSKFADHIQLMVNDLPQGPWLAMGASSTNQNDASVLTTMEVDLEVGVNSVAVKAKNRAGESALSTPVNITLDADIPTRPKQLVGLARVGGEIALSWAAEQSDVTVGYHIYRAKTAFVDQQNAIRVTSQPLRNSAFVDLPLEDGRYFYRVTAVSSKGIESPLSNDVQVESDRLAPVAVVEYHTDGAQDATRGVFGQGELTLTITVSEPLFADPFISITSQGRVFTPRLSAVASDTYQARVQLDEHWPSGDAHLTFSARDRIGNRGFAVTQGASFSVDTQGPIVEALTSQPQSPVRIDAAPTAVTIELTLDEAVAQNSQPELHYSVGLQSHQQVALTHLADERWTAELTFDETVALDAPQQLSFALNAQDELGNVSLWQSRTDQVIELYQGELPALNAPLGLKAQALPQGEVQLTWMSVTANSGYVIYRQTADGTEPVEVARVGSHDERNITEYVERPTSDGQYRYAVATIRSANQQQSLSPLSEWVSVLADSTPPIAPSNLEAELTPVGIALRWEMVSPEAGLTYQIYRAEQSPILSVSDLEPISAAIVDQLALDSEPSEHLPAYAVVAVDQAGNRSAISDTVYLNLSLLPVRNVSLSFDQDTLPTLSWSHGSQSLQGYQLAIGQGANPTLINDGLITETHYQDSGYTSGERRYHLTAIDVNGETSLTRSVLLPDVSINVAQGSVIKRNLFSKVVFELHYNGSEPLPGQRLIADVQGQAIQSDRFTLEPGWQEIAMTIAGDETLPDRLVLPVTLLGKRFADQTVEIRQRVEVPVEQGLVSVDIETRNVTRGGFGEFRYRITNPGDETLAMVTAKNSGQQASGDVRVVLKDLDANTLSAQSYQRNSGENIITLPNRDSVLRVAAGETYRSPWQQFAVPSSAPYQAQLELRIAKIYAHYGLDTQVEVAGLVATNTLKLIDTAYFADIDHVSPNVSFGDGPITIQGRAVDRATGEATPQAPITLVIAKDSFERTVSLMTDEAGQFVYEHTPSAGVSGQFELHAIHPELTERPGQASFTIQAVKVMPNQINLRTVKSVSQTFPIIIETRAETALSEVNIVPTQSLPEGVELFLPQDLSLAENERREISVDLLVGESGPEKGTIELNVMALVGGEVDVRNIGQLSVNFNAEQSRPNLFVAPSMLELAATVTGSDHGAFTLTNRGTEPMYAVTIELLTKEGTPAPNWLQNRTFGQYAQIAPEQSVTLDIALQPQELAATGTEEFIVQITSANHAPRRVPVFTTLVEDGQGSAQFKVSNIYTGTLDAQGKVIQGLQGAKVVLRNEAAQDIEYLGSTDQYGELLLSEVQAGSYQYWVTQSGHQTYVGRLRVKPGVVTNQAVFLNYETVKLDWSVKEVALQDKYEIVLNVDFVTDVPAAVLVAEPAAIIVPELEAGEVFYGEIRLTNHGLVRADNVNFMLPASSDTLRYELLSESLPNTLEAKQSAVIPYRITGLAAMTPDGRGSGGNAGCYSSNQCLNISSSFQCANGDQSNANAQSCFVVPRVCNSSGGGSGDGNGWVWHGGWDWGSDPGEWVGSEESPFPLPECRVDCPDGCESGNNGGGQ